LNNPFYHDVYRSNNFDPYELSNFENITNVPIVTKEMMQQYPLDLRNTNYVPELQSNTGGTSGQQLEFFVDNNAYARERAHMQHAWKTLGYQKTS
jgi:phenylacetate-CoA ligase